MLKRPQIVGKTSEKACRVTNNKEKTKEIMEILYNFSIYTNWLSMKNFMNVLMLKNFMFNK